jgi:2-polyprenyl-3-methyl-5-hydroxy-6-metoxy-1,4-benzoquinol methylase
MAIAAPLGDRRLWVEDSRLSPEFQRGLERYMATGDPTNPRHEDFYRDHAGRRSAWLRQELLWRLTQRRSLRGLRALDFGCGTGSSAVVLAEQGATVIGAEPLPLNLAIAVQRATDLAVAERCRFVRIPYITPEAPSLPFRAASFDLCVAIGVLEHMHDPERIACEAELYRLLKPGGELFIFDTPNRIYPKENHTTELWFAGWLPEPVARVYAVRRGRIRATENFRRRGGNGISRRALDRLFPSSRWHLSYEKSVDEIRMEWARLGTAWALAATVLLAVAHLLRGRAAYWTVSHTIGLTRR